MKNYIPFLLLIMASLAFQPAKAQECQGHDPDCILEMLVASAQKIDRTDWRDQTYREIGKTLAHNEDYEGAIAIIDKIVSPDTRAMTIRGIGMAIAEQRKSKEIYDPLFKKLRTAAEKISEPPSYAVALTYIAMAQAFAGDNEGAWATAADMQNDSLRNKAYGETAEIQAEQGYFDPAFKSIGFISTSSYKDKSLTTVSKIFSDKGDFDNSFKMALAISNAYEQSAALQYILDKQLTHKTDSP